MRSGEERCMLGLGTCAAERLGAMSYRNSHIDHVAFPKSRWLMVSDVGSIEARNAHGNAESIKGLFVLGSRSLSNASSKK